MGVSKDHHGVRNAPGASPPRNLPTLWPEPSPKNPCRRPEAGQVSTLGLSYGPIGPQMAQKVQSPEPQALPPLACMTGEVPHPTWALVRISASP